MSLSNPEQHGTEQSCEGGPAHDQGPLLAAAGSPAASVDPRRWRALSVLALVQFVPVLDVTVVNVALPSIQHGLGFSRAGLT